MWSNISQNCVSKCTRLHLSAYSFQKIFGWGTPLRGLSPSATKDFSPKWYILDRTLLFSLKFETDSYFLKSIKTILYTWANKIANVQNPVSYHSNCNIIMVCRFYIRKKLKKTLNTLEFNVFFFLQKIRITFENQHSLNLCWLPLCKNLFRLTWKNAGSKLRVFTVSLLACICHMTYS